jgi:hypothetical protein
VIQKYILFAPPYARNVDLGGLVVSVLATGPKVRGFDPEVDGFLRVIKIRRFTACKRTLRTRIKMLRKVNSHPSLLTACKMALAVTSGSTEQQRGQLASHQLPRMHTT